MSISGNEIAHKSNITTHQSAVIRPRTIAEALVATTNDNRVAPEFLEKYLHFFSVVTLHCGYFALWLLP
jgi:hypothetical protein